MQTFVPHEVLHMLCGDKFLSIGTVHMLAWQPVHPLTLHPVFSPCRPPFSFIFSGVLP